MSTKKPNNILWYKMAVFPQLYNIKPHEEKIQATDVVLWKDAKNIVDGNCQQGRIFKWKKEKPASNSNYPSEWEAIECVRDVEGTICPLEIIRLVLLRYFRKVFRSIFHLISHKNVEEILKEK